MALKIDLYRKDYEEIKVVTEQSEEENLKLIEYLNYCKQNEVESPDNQTQSNEQPKTSSQFIDFENIDDNIILNVDLDDLETININKTANITTFEDIISRIDKINLTKSNNNIIKSLNLKKYKNEPRNDYYLKNNKSSSDDNGSDGDDDDKGDDSDKDIISWPITKKMLKDVLND
jgi:hypothetical protein